MSVKMEKIPIVLDMKVIKKLNAAHNSLKGAVGGGDVEFKIPQKSLLTIDTDELKGCGISPWGNSMGKYVALPLPLGKIKKMREAHGMAKNGGLKKGIVLKISKSNLQKIAGTGIFSDIADAATPALSAIPGVGGVVATAAAPAIKALAGIIDDLIPPKKLDKETFLKLKEQVDDLSKANYDLALGKELSKRQKENVDKAVDTVVEVSKDLGVSVPSSVAEVASYSGDGYKGKIQKVMNSNMTKKEKKALIIKMINKRHRKIIKKNGGMKELKGLGFDYKKMKSRTNYGRNKKKKTFL